VREEEERRMMDPSLGQDLTREAGGYCVSYSAPSCAETKPSEVK
jgi:hypothetical protein